MMWARSADSQLPVGGLLQGESDTSHVRISKLSYLNIVFVSFGRQTGALSVQVGSAVFKYSCAHSMFSHAVFMYWDDTCHGCYTRQGSVCHFYNMTLEHAHSSHFIAILYVQVHSNKHARLPTKPLRIKSLT
jgi:hypothetical protein